MQGSNTRVGMFVPVIHRGQGNNPMLELLLKTLTRQPGCEASGVLPVRFFGKRNLRKSPYFTGAPDTIRTCDLCLRRQCSNFVLGDF
jgi:hypothetical protein